MQAKKTMSKKCVGTNDVWDEKDGKLGVRGARDVVHIAAEATKLFNIASSGAWVQASGVSNAFQSSTESTSFP
jgi:hypothetical protein